MPAGPARLINTKYITIRAEKVASPVTALQLLTWVGTGNNVLDWGPDRPMGRGNFQAIFSKKNKGVTAPTIFGPCLLWPNGWMDQDATWYEGRPWPRRKC